MESVSGKQKRENVFTCMSHYSLVLGWYSALLNSNTLIQRVTTLLFTVTDTH
jgi:hypothetical protein